MNKNVILILSVIFLAGLAVAIPKLTHKNESEINKNIPATGNIDGSINNPKLDYEVVPGKVIKDSKGLVLLERAIPSTTASIKIKLEEIVNSLKENTNNYNKWLELGIYRKAAMDYEGAVVAWDYATSLLPNDKTAYINLGDTYHYYIKDYIKAEIALKKAISLEPSFSDSYHRLFNLYSESYLKETTKAVDILKEGITKTSSIGLYIDLATYYKAKGDMQNYQKTLNEAKVAAQKVGDTEALVEIEKMINS